MQPWDCIEQHGQLSHVTRTNIESLLLAFKMQTIQFNFADISFVVVCLFGRFKG